MLAPNGFRCVRHYGWPQPFFRGIAVRGGRLLEQMGEGADGRRTTSRDGRGCRTTMSLSSSAAGTNDISPNISRVTLCLEASEVIRLEKPMGRHKLITNSG